MRFATYGGRVVERALWAAVRRARRETEVLLPAVGQPEPWARLSQAAEVRAALLAALGDLPQRLRAVVTQLYGLDGGAGCTQAALGRAWGISGERVRQLHVQALVHLRHPGLNTALYQACTQDSREVYQQALQRNRAWQRRQRR